MQMETNEIMISRKREPLKLEIPAEGTVLVPDIKPDVAEILEVVGRAVLDKADCENGRLSVSGRILYTVLYRPEDTESVLCAISGSLPFSGMETVQGIQEGMPVHFSCSAPFNEASVLNSRKLSVRGVVEITAVPYENEKVSVLASDAEGICAQKQKTEGFTLVAETQNRIHLTERFSLPNGELPIREILLYESTVRDFSVKVVDNKAVIKGEIHMCFLYQPEDSFSPASFEETIEIAEIQDIPGLTPDLDCCFDLKVEEFSAEAVPGENGQMFDVLAEISLLFSCVATEPMAAEWITDGFIPGRETKAVQKEITMQKLLPGMQIPVSVKDRITLAGDMQPISRVLRFWATPSPEWAEGQLRCDLLLGLLYQDTSGNVCFLKQPLRRDVYCEIPTNAVCDGKARLLSLEYVISGETALEFRAELAIEIQGTTEETVQAVTDMEFSEEELLQRPSVVICFIGEGDTLWSIAKRYKITEEEILAANAMHEGAELTSGQRLLIPRYHAE